MTQVNVNLRNKAFTALVQTNEHSNNGYKGYGVFAFFNKPEGKGNTVTYFDKNLSNFTWRTRNYRENYYTPNTMLHHKRSTDDVIGYNALYFDLDTMKDGISPDIMFMGLKAEMEQGKILVPTYVTGTGHGLDLVYVFEYQVTDRKVGHKISYVKGAWNNTEYAMGKALNPYCCGTVDFTAMDNCRLLRYPGTFNVKYLNKHNHYHHRVLSNVVFYSGKKYDFWELHHKYCPEDDESVKQMRKVNRTVNWVNFKVHTMNNWERAEMHRSGSVKKLVLLRHCKMNGYRNKALIIFASLLVQADRYYILKNSKAVKYNIAVAVQNLNAMFTESLGKDEVQIIVNKVFKAQFHTSKTNISKYGYRTDRICSKRFGLDISFTEQLKLKYLKTSKTMRKVRALRARKQYQIHKRMKKIVEAEKTKQLHFRILKTVNRMYRMHHKGATYQQVAKAFGLSMSKVYRLIKTYGYTRFICTYCVHELENNKITLFIIKIMFKLMNKYENLLYRIRDMT